MDSARTWQFAWAMFQVMLSLAIAESVEVFYESSEKVTYSFYCYLVLIVFFDYLNT